MNISSLTEKALNPELPIRIGGRHWFNLIIAVGGAFLSIYWILSAKTLSESTKPIIAELVKIMGEEKFIWIIPPLLSIITIKITHLLISSIKGRSPFSEVIITKDQLVGYGFEIGGLAKSSHKISCILDKSSFLYVKQSGGSSPYYTVSIYIPSLKSDQNLVQICTFPSLEKIFIYVNNVIKKLNISDVVVFEAKLKEKNQSLHKACADLGLSYRFK